MKRIKILWIFVVVIVSIISSYVGAYLFGMKSWDNSISNIQRIEKEYNMDIPIVSFIFDPRGPHVETIINKLNTELGEDKIYHISLSPNMYSAKEVAEGKFDKQYKQFFQDIKKNNLRVVFRTMHEMNGGRYPRSSNPENFKKAWIHTWELSRTEWLNQNNILFDMSINARDLPAKWWNPSQTATFIQCTQSVKAKLKCPTFEEYYPGDKYVDLMWVTFYNRGKWNSNRWRWTPDQIVNNTSRHTLDRLKKLDKQIFVDEVGTTAVNYTWTYSFNKSLEVYENNKELKNNRLLQLRSFLLRESRIVGMIYFNVDLTNGLKNRTLGELDRSVIDFASNKFYEKIVDIYETGKPNEYTALYYLFNVQRLQLNKKTYLVKSDYIKPVKDLYISISNQTKENKEQLTILDTIKKTWSLSKKYKRFTKTDIAVIVDTTKKFLQ